MKQLYDVYINSRLEATAVTEEEAWDIIGEQHIGACHMVFFTGTNELAEEFIPY